MNVYFREGGNLAVFAVDTEDHDEAIATVAEEVGVAGESKGPFLALISGGGSSC